MSTDRKSALLEAACRVIARDGADRMRVRKSHVERLLDGSAGLFQRLTADKTSLSIFSADEIVNFAVGGYNARQLLAAGSVAVLLTLLGAAPGVRGWPA